MKIIIIFSLILLVSPAFGANQLCWSSVEIPEICSEFTTLPQPTVLGNGATYLELRYEPGSNNTIPPNTFKQKGSTIYNLFLEGKEGEARSSVSLFRDSFAGLPTVSWLEMKNLDVNFNNENAFRPVGALSYLKLDNIGLTVVPTEIFTYLESLSSLTLQYNIIRTIRANSFAPLKNLEKLTIWYAKTQIIERGAFNGLSRLKKLVIFAADLSNSVGHLNGVFAGLPNLRELSLMSCKIEHISEQVFEGVPKLDELDLRWNNISAIARGTFSNMSVDYINLIDSPIKEIRKAEWGLPESTTVVT